jgi:hypothetical protein
MKLTDDLQSRKLLHFKGLLFAFLGVSACILILVESPHLRTAGFLLIAIWSWCRFYYFLFYVLEKYAGRDRKYAGLLDALGYLIKGDRSNR